MQEILFTQVIRAREIVALGKLNAPAQKPAELGHAFAMRDADDHAGFRQAASWSITSGRLNLVTRLIQRINDMRQCMSPASTMHDILSQTLR
jgi:hypothetical protein